MKTLSRLALLSYHRTISAVRSANYYMVEWLKLEWGRHQFQKSTNLFGQPIRPLISIYIPTHNRCQLLIERSLPSILAQSYTNFEIIVVAHGCTDNTVEEVRRLDDKRIRLIELPRKQTYPPTIENHWFAGRVAASNAGLMACRGDWIATNDDDDIWHPTHLSSLLQAAIEQDLEFVSAGSFTPTEEIKPYKLGKLKIGSIQTWLYRSYLKSFQFNPQCWRKNWDRVCDTDLQKRFSNAGVRMGYLDLALAKIMPKPGNVEIGLKGANEDGGQYLDHLDFK